MLILLNPAVRLLTAIAIVALLPTGCSKVQYSAPPVPPGKWTGRNMLYVTASWMPVRRYLPNIGIGARWKLSDRDMIGLNMAIPNPVWVPLGLEYVRYVPIEPNAYGTMQAILHQLMMNDGFSPSLAANLGLSTRQGRVRHTLRAGIGYMSDPAENGLNVWNPFRTTGGTAFIPMFAYDIEAAPVILSLAYSPGYHRYLINSLRPEEGAASDSSWYFPRRAVYRLIPAREVGIGRSYGYCWELQDGRRLWLRTAFQGPGDWWFWRRSARAWRSFFEMQHLRQDTARRYCWVIVDSAGTTLRADMMELDTAAMFRNYEATGNLDLREDPGVEKYIRETEFPVWSDFSVMAGYRLAGDSDE